MRNIRTRTTMSYAFEAALRPYEGLLVDMVPPVAREVVSRFNSGFREEPGWTATTRMSDAKASERKARRKGARK